MKSIVRLSKYACTITILVNGFLFLGCFATLKDEPKLCILVGCLLLLLILGCWFAPISITATPENIIIRSIFSKRLIPMSEIAAVAPFQPTMGAIRILGSGGYMGYWGLFREGDIGRYTAYYGKSSDCFLLTLKNGKKYVLGCENPGRMMEYIVCETQKL